MHQHRRRKKRPSYGVRTVEITRGKNGFGFTISGQAPCILSCIITGSPAEKAGLRPGDFLIAVNGQNVSKAPHDDVVRLIGNSNGILKLQIAENYYSDSSEEEFVSVVKLRPKYPHKVRHRQQQNNVSRAEKVVRDLQTGALFVDHIHGSSVVMEVPQKHPPREKKSITVSSFGPSRSNKALLDLILQQRLQEAASRSSRQHISSQSGCIPSTAKPKPQVCLKKKEPKVLKSRSHPEHLNTTGGSPGEVFHSIFTEQELNSILYPAILAAQNQFEENENQGREILKAVVGYLGTIEMPKEPQLPNSRLQTIRNCIRRLRIEKKVHTLVLMTVFPESIILINPQGLTLAEFAAEKITFSGVYSDDKKFFGLVTNHGTSSDELSEGSLEDPVSISSSCHVFMVDPKLTPHHQHLKRAKAFHITCTLDPLTNKCKEFPESADSILQAVVGLYRSRLGLNVEAAPGLEFHDNMSPQPSNTSSNSSNSDSGIGFRDEGNTSDRVFVVDVDNYHHYSTNSLDRQAFATPGFGMPDASLRPFSLSQESSLVATKSTLPAQPGESKTSSAKPSTNCQFDRLTVRAMPDPVGFERENTSCYSNEHLDSQSNSSNIRSSMHKFMQLKQETSQGAKSGQSHSPAENLSGALKFGNDKKQVGPNSVEKQVDKLSPKVYGLNFPLKHLDDLHQCGTSAESAGWECTSCSTEDLHSQVRDILLHEGQDMTEQEEDGSQDVHPPTQEEGDSELENFEVGHGLEATKKWARTSSLRRHLGRKRSLHRSTHEAGTVSDGELASGKVSTSSSMLALDHISDTTSRRSSCASERPVDVGRVGSWAAGFNILLEDPAGLHTFSEFLKKEFSQENITFWIACEKYRQVTDPAQMALMAKEIYSTHLCIGAHEPVNVDSHARQVAEEGLDSPTPDLFLLAQKQIFNLMKFDCYQRFLKSSMFKECMLREMQGQPLLYQGQTLQIDNSDDKGKGKASAEEKKRKSLIPWHRLSKIKSNESKSSKLWDRHSEIRKSLKKKKEKDSQKLDDTSSTQSDITGSRSSLTGSETGMGLMYKNISSRESLNSAELTLFPSHCGADGNYYCRVILPDCSTTVVRTQKGETVGEMLLKLLERRNLTYNAVEAFMVGSHQPLDHGVDVTTLSCREIRVEQVILFCLELPNKKTIGVKAKSGKLCRDILRPVLHKYGYKIDNVAMILASTQKQVVVNAPITTIDNHRIIVHSKDSFQVLSDWSSSDREMGQVGKEPRSPHNFPDLEELTNQIFEDLLKSRPEFHFDGLSGVDLDGNVEDKEKENFPQNRVCCNSSSHQSKLDSRIKPSNGTGAPVLDGRKSQSPSKALLPHNASQPGSMCGEIPDSWKRTQLCCSKDQPAAEKKFESNQEDSTLGKENCPTTCSRTDINIHSLSFVSNDDFSLPSNMQTIDHGFGSESVYPTHQQAEKYFASACYNYDFGDNKSSDRFLRNLGIIPSIGRNIKSRPAPLPPSLPSSKPPPRPMSHPPPRLPPRPRPSTKSLPSCLQDPCTTDAVGSGLDMDSTLTCNDSFDLDLDMDVTLKVHPSSDDSLSPSRIPYPSDMNTTLHVDEANYSPPPPLEGANKSSPDVPYPQVPLRRISCEPPPVPPKALSRGPPPRPPSRQLMNINPVFCTTSEDDVSDGESGIANGASDRAQSRSKSKYINLSKDYGDFNISFV